MKATPPYFIALFAIAAFLVLHVLFSRGALTPSVQAQRLAEPSTCSTNNSSVIDSFGEPCLNLSALVRGQLLYSYQSPNLSYLYCGIPKNGCTYHIAIMHRLMGYKYEGGYAVHNSNNKYRVRPGGEVYDLLLGDFMRYAVVRNPIQRALSAYLNKVEKNYEDADKSTPETFRAWVKENVKPGMSWKGTNPHWKAQVEFCGFKIRDLWKYFKIFRVEKPQEYVEYMERFLPNWVLKDGWDMPRNKSFREHVLGPRTRTENTTQKFYDYVDLDTFDYLKEVYREDIEMLGYEEEVEKLRKNVVELDGESR